MASDPLSVENILTHMAEALPTHTKDDTNSDLSSSYEAIALFSHACMISVGFRLLGFGEGQKIGNIQASSPFSYHAIANRTWSYEHRIRMPTTRSSSITAVELLIRLTFFSLCSLAVIYAICCQGGSTRWEGRDSGNWIRGWKDQSIWDHSKRLRFFISFATAHTDDEWWRG